MELEQFLKEIPLFSSIPEAQIRQIAQCFKIKHYKKDDIVFAFDDASDALYIIRSGTVFIHTQKKGNRHFQAELKRGDFFGEMALLSDSPRTLSASVALDATLFYLKKEDFFTLLAQNTHIGLFLSRLYARRLSSGSRTGTRPPKPAFFTLGATDPGLGLAHFLYSMAYHISTESNKKVLVIEPHLELDGILKQFSLHPVSCHIPDIDAMLSRDITASEALQWFTHRSGFKVLQINKSHHKNLSEKLPELMETVRQEFDLVVFSLSHCFDSLARQMVRLSDKNLLIIKNTPEAFQDVKSKLTRLRETAGIGLDRVRVGVSHLYGSIGIPRETLKKDLNLSETPGIWVEKTTKAVDNQIDTEKRFPVKGARALARELAGVRVGLALGAGAARGWSHIGVLKALESADIHIDMISGTSMGALVGAIFAYKGSVDHLIKYTIAKFPTRFQARKKIFDYTLPLNGLLRGKKAMGLVGNAICNADFMDLKIPTFLVGVDILTGEEVLFETGDVTRAVRSSLSLPAVFVPFRYQGRWMVDGGLLNPVPVDILEQKGADKIIAVCVESPDAGTVHPKKKSPNILQVISRTISIVHGTATTGFAQKSDLVIYPDAREFTWDDFHKGDILMGRGESACQKVIDEIKTLVQTTS